MNMKKRAQQIIKLGIGDFETSKDVAKLQADMLLRLERWTIAPCQYESLVECRPNYCAYKKCLEACWFGSHHRRLKEIPAIHDLLQNSNTPLYEVRFVRGMWARPSRQLHYAPIAAAKKLNC